MELAEKLGYPSAETMMELINCGTMNNLPVTAHDAVRAYAAYGTPIPLIQGKTVHTAEKSTTQNDIFRGGSSLRHHVCGRNRIFDIYWKTSRFVHGFRFGIGSEWYTQQSSYENGYDFPLQRLLVKTLQNQGGCDGW